MTVPFSPTPFTTPVVNPASLSILNRAPYLSTSEFQFAPTALDTSQLVDGGNDAAQEVALAQMIDRASGWIDEICFHGAGGVLAASQNTEGGWIKPKADGWAEIVASYMPILAVLGVAFGSIPGNLASLDDQAAPMVGIDGRIITVPTSYSCGPVPYFGASPIGSSGSRVYCVWQYVCGFPHTTLAEACDEEATELTLTDTLGAFAGTPYQILDYPGGNSSTCEVVNVQSVSGNTIELTSPTIYAHTPPEAPDAIMVSALPPVVRQAAILLTGALCKVKGDNSLTLAEIEEPKSSEETDGGAAFDVQIARAMLKPFTTPVVGHR